MSLEKILRSFILTMSNDNFESLIQNGGCYPLFLRLFSKNGIYADRLPEKDFWPNLFLTIHDNREELLIMLSAKDFFTVISRIVNLMLKDMNRSFYRIGVMQKKESVEDISLQPQEEDEKKEISMVKVRDIISKTNLKDQIILGSYFGLNRSYILNIDQICTIIRVKRSSAFAKVKRFKNKVREE